MSRIGDARQLVIDSATEVAAIAKIDEQGYPLQCAMLKLRLSVEELVWEEYKAQHAMRFALNPEAQLRP